MNNKATSPLAVCVSAHHPSPSPPSAFVIVRLFPSSYLRFSPPLSSPPASPLLALTYSTSERRFYSFSPLHHSFPTSPPPPSHPFISVVLPALPPSIHPVSLPPLRKTDALTKFFSSKKCVGGGIRKLILSVGAVAELDVRTIHTHTGWGGALLCFAAHIQKQEQTPEARSRARCYYSPMKNKQRK